MIHQRTLRHDLVAMTLAAAAATIAMSANAAVDTFAKIGDIKGETLDGVHKGESDVLSWSFGTAATKRNAPCSFEMSITKRLDAASPLLMMGVAQGTIYPTATLKARKPGDNLDYLVITMNEVLVTQVQPSGGGGGDIVESVSLAYSSATIVYKPQDPLTGAYGADIIATIPATCP